MRRTIRSSLLLAFAAALAAGSLSLAPAQAAPAQKQTPPAAEQTAAAVDLSARKRHRRYHRHRGGDREALQMFGIMMGTIATLAARDRARRDCRRYGDCYGYGYGYPPPRRYYRPYRYYRY